MKLTTLVIYPTRFGSLPIYVLETLTLLVKSRPLNFQEHRRALLLAAVTVSLPFHCRMQGGLQGVFELTNRVNVGEVWGASLPMGKACQRTAHCALCWHALLMEARGCEIPIPTVGRPASSISAPQFSWVCFVGCTPR
jgi:hypothetical protein